MKYCFFPEPVELQWTEGFCYDNQGSGLTEVWITESRIIEGLDN